MKSNLLLTVLRPRTPLTLFLLATVILGCGPDFGTRKASAGYVDQAPPLEVKQSATGCNCLETGVCTCGPDCDCGFHYVSQAPVIRYIAQAPAVKEITERVTVGEAVRRTARKTQSEVQAAPTTYYLPQQQFYQPTYQPVFQPSFQPSFGGYYGGFGGSFGGGCAGGGCR